MSFAPATEPRQRVPINVPCICQDHISILDFLACRLLNDLIGHHDTLANVIVDFAAEKIFGLLFGATLSSIFDRFHSPPCFWNKVLLVGKGTCEAHLLLNEVNIGVADFELKLPDGVAHRDRHRSSGNQVGDLRGEMGHEMAGEGILRGSRVVLDDLYLQGQSSGISRMSSEINDPKRTFLNAVRVAIHRAFAPQILNSENNKPSLTTAG